MEQEARGVWSAHATQWERVGAPLRPGPEDGALLMQGVGDGPHDVLVLGVTPEMARLPWAPGSTLLAVDRAAAMIERVWPGFPEAGQGALQANWLTMELPDASRDRVVSDGCFVVTAWPHEHGRVLDQVRRILRPDGRFVFRMFVRPGAEAVEQVIERARSGGFASFHGFKLALLMACQPDTARGVVTGEVWARWRKAVPDVEGFAANTGWPLAQVRTIDAYRDQTAPYSFPLRAELEQVITDHGFAIHDVQWPGYPLGERCPTYTLVPV